MGEPEINYWKKIQSILAGADVEFMLNQAAQVRDQENERKAMELDVPSEQTGAFMLKPEIWDMILFHLDMLTLDRNVHVAYANLVKQLYDERGIQNYCAVGMILFSALAEKILKLERDDEQDD